jgi:hypothetical protein
MLSFLDRLGLLISRPAQQCTRTGSLRTQLQVEHLESRLVPSAPAVDPNALLRSAFALGDTTRNRRVNSEIGSRDDVDLFRFEVARAGQTVAIRLQRRPNSKLNPFLRIFDSRGNDLKADVKTTRVQKVVAAVVEHRFDTRGTYYVGASARGNEHYDPRNGTGARRGDSFGTDALTVAPNGVTDAPDPDDQLTGNEATRLNLRSGRATNQALPGPLRLIEFGADVDMFRFRGSAGQLIAMDLDTPRGSRLDACVRLFQADGEEVGFSDDGTAPGEAPNLDPYLEATLPKTGEYYLGVSGFPNTSYDATDGSGDIGSDRQKTKLGYALTVTVGRPPADEDENDQIAEASPLGDLSKDQASPTQNFFIFPESDVDMFQFAVAAGQTLSFAADRAENSELDPHLRLFESGGTELPLRRDAAGNAQVSYSFTRAGSYYLGVSARGNAGYDAVRGSGDQAGNSIGDYVLTSASAAAPLPDSALRRRRRPGDAEQALAAGATVGGKVFVDDEKPYGKYTVGEQPVNPRGNRFVFLDTLDRGAKPYDGIRNDGERRSNKLSGSLSFVIKNVAPGVYHARISITSSRQEYVTVPIDKKKTRNGKAAPGYHLVVVPARPGSRLLFFGLTNSHN